LRTSMCTPFWMTTTGTQPSVLMSS
jgi:hypothetical protein